MPTHRLNLWLPRRTPKGIRFYVSSGNLGFVNIGSMDFAKDLLRDLGMSGEVTGYKITSIASPYFGEEADDVTDRCQKCWVMDLDVVGTVPAMKTRMGSDAKDPTFQLDPRVDEWDWDEHVVHVMGDFENDSVAAAVAELGEPVERLPLTNWAQHLRWDLGEQASSTDEWLDAVLDTLRRSGAFATTIDQMVHSIPRDWTPPLI